MKPLFLFHPRCNTCKKARTWLNEAGIDYIEQDLTKETPTVDSLTDWQRRAGITASKMFNTSGGLYRELRLSDRLKDATDTERLHILGTDGMLVKRPVLVCDAVVLFGFKEAEWEAAKDKMK